MRRLLLLCVLLATIVTGCSQNHFNVPTENFAERVRGLGVAPIFVDVDSDIKHPQKEQLIALLAETNRKYEQQFVRKLKATGNFYTITLMEGDAQNIFTKLFFRREHRNDATISYNKYFWKNDELRDYLQKNNLDALMLIVVSGLTKSDTITSIGQLKSLTSDYNYLTMTAQIVDANGAILWEYPNFRQRFLSYDPLINLEYPDFSEAAANLVASAQVKFKSLEGIRRTLDQKRKDLLLRETLEPEVYGRQFDEMLSLLKYDADKEKKNPVPAAETARPLQPVEQPVKTPAEMTPKVSAPPTAPTPAAPPVSAEPPAPEAPAATAPSAPPPAVKAPRVTRVPVLEKPVNPADEITPANGSTL